MGYEIFLYIAIISSVLFVALFIYLLRQTIKKRKEAQHKLFEQDLCSKCKYVRVKVTDYLSIETHCEILDQKVGSINRDLDEVVPFPCLECPFECYLPK